MNPHFRRNPVSRVIGVDIGTKCGIAVLDEMEDGELIFHTKEFDVSDERETLRARDFFFRVKQSLEWYKAPGVTSIYYEYVNRHLGVKAAHWYGVYRMALLLAAENIGIPIHSVGVTKLKKFACGKGNANKNDMILSAQANFGAKSLTDNEADALWLAEFGRCVENAIGVD